MFLQWSKTRSSRWNKYVSYVSSYDERRGKQSPPFFTENEGDIDRVVTNEGRQEASSAAGLVPDAGHGPVPGQGRIFLRDLVMVLTEPFCPGGMARHAGIFHPFVPLDIRWAHGEIDQSTGVFREPVMTDGADGRSHENIILNKDSGVKPFMTHGGPADREHTRPAMTVPVIDVKNS